MYELNEPLLNKYYCYYLGVALISLVGILGNIFCAYVLFRKKPKEAWSQILVGLVLFDTSMLIVYLLNGVLFYLQANGLISVQNLFYFLNLPLLAINKTAFVGSVYSTVLITIEQYYVIASPIPNERGQVTAKGVTYLLAFILQFAICFNIPRWVEINLEYNSETYVFYYHGIIWLSICFVLPVFIIAIFTIRIWRKAQYVLSKYEGNTNEEIHRTSLIKMLVVLLCLFIITNTVYFLSVFHFTVIMTKHPIIAELYASGPLAVNAAIKVFIYCLTVKEFKKKIMRAFCMVSGSSFLTDPANSRETIMDTKNVELISYKYNAGFDDCKVKCVIRN